VTAAGDPLSAFVGLAAALMSPPCLLQMALWAALAAGVGYAASLRRLEYRLWAWAVAFSLVFTLTSVPPAAFWRRAVTVGGLVSCVAVAGLVVLLALLPGPGRSRAAVGMRKVRGVQEDRTQA
jgi:predicted membrane protein